VEQSGKEQAERAINHFLEDMLAAGTVQRAVLLEHGDDPAIAPGQLMIRVFIPAPDLPADYERALAAWQEVNRTGMAEARRMLSARLPSARLWSPAKDKKGKKGNPRVNR